MLCAPEIEPVPPGAFLWRFYDPAIKTDLFSTGLQTASGTFLVDPIPLAPEVLAGVGPLAGIIITNENHLRSATQFAERFQVPTFGNQTVVIGEQPPFPPALTAIPIEGAAGGETAIYWEAHGGTVVVGDALINFEPYGFTFLPAKYCSNFKLMRTSLAKLLDYPFDRMFFAHGTPILSRAHERLETLLRERR